MNNIPTITRNLLVINVVVFLATYALRGLGIDLNDLLGLHFMLAPDFYFTSSSPICSHMEDGATYSSICSPCGCSVASWNAHGARASFSSIT